MASNIKLPDAFRQTRADTWATRVGNAGKLRIYTGSQPADADTAASGTLLAEFTLGSPFAPGASGEGVVSPTLPSNVNASATGTAAWFRIVQSNGTTVVCDGTVGTSASDINLVTTSITSGQPVSITSWTITEGGA